MIKGTYLLYLIWFQLKKMVLSEQFFDKLDLLTLKGLDS